MTTYSDIQVASCPFHFPYRSLLPFAGFSILRLMWTTTPTTFRVGDRERTNSVRYSFSNFSHGTNIYVDDFINDDKDPTEQDEAPTQLRLSWTQLPDQEDGFRQLLEEILELSLNSGGGNLALREPTEHPIDSSVRMPPTSQDFPLWRVSCRVRLNFFNDVTFYVKSI